MWAWSWVTLAKKVPDIVPVDALAGILEEFGDNALDSLEGQGFLRVMNALEAKAVELTPVDKGTLEGSTTVRIYHEGKKLVGLLLFNTPYASKVHEMPPDSIGPRTANKPGNEYGRAGPKYLERPLRGFTQAMSKGIGKALQEIWGQAAKSGKDVLKAARAREKVRKAALKSTKKARK